MKGTFLFSAIVLLGAFSLSAIAAKPDPNLTPGVLCSEQDPNFKGFFNPEKIARCNRNVSQQEKAQVAKEYGGLPQSEWKNYEFDHMIPLCAGGSDDIKNLWPQPIAEAKQKDVLEDDVCIAMQAGTMTQAEAVLKVQEWFAAH